jgi:hypothetical protein
MNQNPNMTGLAGLLASKGRDGDSVLVHMTPGEVEGLQAIALAAGGSLTTNPNTGLPEANFLKSILPAIAGSTLKALFPNLGSAATGLIVGGLSGLVDKSFDKGMRSGLSAYSGAKTIEGLQAAREAVRPIATPKIVSGEDELSSERLRDARRPIDLSKIRVETPRVQTVTKAPSLFGEGVRALFKPEGQEAFLQSVEGPYKRQGLRDLSRSAYFAGLANIAAREPKKLRPGSGSSNARFYVPGEVNPLYGQGYDQWYFKPGYFSDKYPGYAAGGEVMVSPDAVLPQTLSVSQPAFTQDREGLKDYYESLLSPPGPPRDISELNAYLDDLRNRLRRPYQPVSSSDWQYGELPTGGGGGGGGGTSPTPDGTDPYATGVTGTPADLIKPPTPPAPPAPPEEPDFSNWVPDRPATPSDLFIPGGVPDFDVEPDTQTSIEVVEGGVAPDYSGLPIVVGTPPELVEPEGETSIEVVEGDVASDYAGLPITVGTVGELVQPKENEGTVTVEEIDEQAVADDIRNRLSQDLGGPPISFPSGYTPVEFTQPEYSIEVEEVAEQEPAEESKGITKEDVKNAGVRIAEQALRSAFPIAGLVYDLYKELSDKEGKVTVEEVKEGEKEGAEEEAKDEAKEESEDRADISYTPSRESGASFMNFGLGQERFGLAKAAAGSEFEDNLPGGQITIEELGYAGGGRIPRFAQGGLGSLQQYAVGGKLVNGAGDGMSDDIKANINGTQEARLADGEFVIPADVVSHLGNGSTDAGAKQLYAMMDRIRKVRTGRNKQAPEVNVRKHMPA